QKGNDDESIFALIPGDDDESASMADASVSNSRPEIRISGKSAIASGCSIAAYDIAGHIVASAHDSLDLGKLPAGMYIIHATANGHTSVIKTTI
ncbi:MAG: T9SS type A sorting domain-containing protein, partial [Muribaculaceae bacterium]|nr:T9SS type A sorting domain-containing protein [Muribaculaceae bacterium]